MMRSRRSLDSPRRWLLPAGLVLFLMMTFLLPGFGYASEQGVGPLPQEVRDSGDEWEVVGTARLRKWGFHVYDAALWAPEGDWNWDRPFFMDFEYARSFEGEEIAELGAELMKDLGHCEVKEECWLEEQVAAFPDVSDGDRLAGWYRPDKPVRFYFNGDFRHEVEDPDFARPFFEIWLSPDTSEPRFRRSLLSED